MADEETKVAEKTVEKKPVKKVAPKAAVDVADEDEAETDEEETESVEVSYPKKVAPKFTVIRMSGKDYNLPVFHVVTYTEGSVMYGPEGQIVDGPATDDLSQTVDQNGKFYTHRQLLNRKLAAYNRIQNKKFMAGELQQVNRGR